MNTLMWSALFFTVSGIISFFLGKSVEGLLMLILVQLFIIIDKMENK